MKIKYKFVISLIVSIVISLIIGITGIYILHQQLNIEFEKSIISNERVMKFIDLSDLTKEYLQYYNLRSMEQWFITYDLIDSMIVIDESLSDEEKNILKKIKANHQDINLIFSDLVARSEKNFNILNTDINSSKPVEERFIIQINLKFQQIFSASEELIHISNDKIINKIRDSYFVMLGIIATIIPISGLIFFLMNSSVVSSIIKLQKATQEVRKRNYDVRVDIKSKDELEDLADSFNETTEALAQTEQSRNELDVSKTQFLSITSHELRSPMTPMKAQIQMLIKGYLGKLNKKQNESLDIVFRNIDRLDNIILDFLDISRIESARLKFNYLETNLSSYIKRLVNEMKGFHPEKKIEIILNMNKLPVIKVDPNRAMQVLRNLINNAMKFSDQNSKVVVDVKAQNKEILFKVKDTGIGILAKDQRRLFEPFYQVEQSLQRKYSGTGLGLSICKGIVESQGGKIWLDSIFGKGTTFYFTVPFKPVEKTKSINLLFSSEPQIQEKIKKLLIFYLGPIGESEFEKLKENIEYNNIESYLKELKAHHIIHKKSYDALIREISKILKVNKK